MDADCDSDGEFYDCVEDVDDFGKFFALAIPQEKWTERKGFVAVDFKEAMKKLKEFKGARLKVFHKMNEALRFAETPAESLVSPQSKDKIRMRRDVDPFPNVSQRDLNELRCAIDRGDIDRISEMVWNNPRHLVNESDFPTVLQIRFRYNAIHECCYRGQADVLKRVLEILEMDDFWRTLHPTVDAETHASRRSRIIDLFLNSPDTGCLETPLHFAAKFGHVECVELLAEQELVCTSARNREGRTAAEIVCTRCTSAPDRTERRRRILDVLRGQFVLLLASDSGDVTVEAPCDWRSYRTNRRRPGRLRAFAGPMSGDEARQFRQLLLRPLRQLGRSGAAEYELFSARLMDSEKGFERAGRHLAAKLAVPWLEYWPFLDDFVDLTSEGGLSLLEERVRAADAQTAWEEYREPDQSELNCTPDSLSTNGDVSSPPHLQTNNSSTGASWLSPLSRLFSRLTVRSPGSYEAPVDDSPSPPLPPHENRQSTPPPPPPPPPLEQPLVTSTPVRWSKPKDSVRRCPPSVRRGRRSLTGREEGLQREDVHVFRALSQLDAARLARFPSVRRWRDEVSEDVLELSETASPRRSLSWHPSSMVT